MIEATGVEQLFVGVCSEAVATKLSQARTAGRLDEGNHTRKSTWGMSSHGLR